MSNLRTTQNIIGSQTARVTLESTYTAGNTSAAIWVSNAIQLFLLVEYTMGAAETANSVDLRIRFADMQVENATRLVTPATADWYTVTSESVTGGVSTISLYAPSFTAVSAAATYDRFILPIQAGHAWIQVAAKETGVSANKGTASVQLVVVEQETIN
jgi:hypothetical protein